MEGEKLFLVDGVTVVSPLGVPDNRVTREIAFGQLEGELREFCWDGLVELRRALEAGEVSQASWDGCLLSYRNGSKGSVRNTSLGSNGNFATYFWDAGWFKADDVVPVIDREMARREVPAPAEPALV